MISKKVKRGVLSFQSHFEYYQFNGMAPEYYNYKATCEDTVALAA